MSYIPLIKKVKWVDLSDEHQRLRETVEKDLKKACVEDGNIQPIMLQGAFGIGKSTTLYYLFHYGWEILKTPTFYLPLAKIVDKVKEKALQEESGKVENNQLSVIIGNLINEQIEILTNQNWDEIYDIDFPEFKGKDDSSKLSLSEYLKGFQPVKLDIDKGDSAFSFDNITFSESVIREAMSSHRTPLLLVDEFESKFYELKRFVESSGGGILRELFDQIVQSKPFMLVIGNGPASGYEVAKEKGTGGNNDSETAANRRLKTIPIPFPTVDLLKRKFMKNCSNGYVNFIWWMSRCRPGHIQKLWDAIDYKSFKLYNSSDFITRDIFNEPIDESGEDVKYLKTNFFNSLDSYIFPIVNKLLLEFEPQIIKLEDNYKNALKDSENATNFYCGDELVNVEKELLPATKDDICQYLNKCNSEGKYTSVNYLKNLNKYFSYILLACADSNGNMVFNTSCKDEESALSDTFLIPMLELTYDFISQYEDADDYVVKETKDFILDCTKYIERSTKNDNIPENFPSLNGMFSGFKIGKQKVGSDCYIQFSLRAVREIIEQPIGSPSLKYKDISLQAKLSEVNLRQGVLLSNYDKDDRVVFIPILEESMLDDYILRLKEYIKGVTEGLHKSGEKTLRFVYFQQNDKIDDLITDVTRNGDDEIAVAKYKKLTFEDYSNYQFNFGGQISDFIDSVAKIAIIGCASCDLSDYADDGTISIKSVIEKIKSREWTKQKEVIRTIEHYEKLVCEGDNSVLRRIESDSKKEYNEVLENTICNCDDYAYNITCDFTKALDETVTDELSKYIGLYYILEKAKSKTNVSETLFQVMKTVGSRNAVLYLAPKTDNITESLYFNQISSIISSEEAKNLIHKYDNNDKLIERLTNFMISMKNDNVGNSLTDLLNFIQSKLKDHWIEKYNEKMSYYGFQSGEILMKLLYLDNCVKDIDLGGIRMELAERIKEKEQELLLTRTNVSSAITSITEMLYSQRYRKENSDNMPFHAYTKELQRVSALLSQCKKILDEENSSTAVLIIIWSIVCRIASISTTATILTNQIVGIHTSLSQKKIYIEGEYQTPINNIYKDQLTAKLIEFNEQAVKYEGNFCWYQFARQLTPTVEASTIFDSNLVPTLENTLKPEDVKKFNDYLQVMVNTPGSKYKKKMDEVLDICKKCQAESDQYKKLLGYINNLLNFDEQ